MKRHTTCFIALLLLQGLFGEMDPDHDACIQCHLEIDEELETPVMTRFENDVHWQKGISCDGCHGGDPEAWDDEDEAMYDSESFIEGMTKIDEIDVCSKCHSDPSYMRQYSASVKTDQKAQYWTSGHGMALKSGNENVATCTSCHDVHGMYEVSDPRATVYALNLPSTCNECHSDGAIMAGTGLPVNQYELFSKSVHGIALLKNQDTGSPACNDCHGNHGAAPPDVGHVSDICGTCHVNNKTLFEESPLKDKFANEDIGQCEGCHGYHDVLKPTDEFLMWEDPQSVCQSCHEDDPDGEARQMSDTFYEMITSFKSRISRADSLLNDVEQKGMEISEYYESLERSHRALVQARTATHGFSIETVQKTLEPGLKEVEASIVGAMKAKDNWVFRREGLFVFSLIITLVIVGLILKIRDMENEPRE